MFTKLFLHDGRFCTHQGSCIPKFIALLPIAISVMQTPFSDTVKLNLRHSQTLCRALFKRFVKRVFVMTGVWTSSQTMATWQVWCSAALRWRKWASMRTRLWRSMEILTSSPQPSRELCMESTSCVLGFDHWAGPVRLTEHLSCLRMYHRLYTKVRCMVLHGSAVAGHACVNGSVTWLLGLTYYNTACMCALWCQMVVSTYRTACMSCTSELSCKCCAHVREGMVHIELTRNMC